MTRQSSLILITFVSFSELRVLECNSFEWFNFFRQLTALFILNLSRIQISEHSLYCKIWISFLECNVGCFTELELSSAFLLAWSLRFFCFNDISKHHDSFVIQVPCSYLKGHRISLFSQVLSFMFISVIVIPVRVPLTQTPLFNPWQDWALGILHMKITCALALMGPNWWLKVLSLSAFVFEWNLMWWRVCLVVRFVCSYACRMCVVKSVCGCVRGCVNVKL